MNTTLDQWEVLRMVVQMGGFTAAAEELHRSHSTISYAISNLQEQLGIRLLELKGRKAELTEAGREMLTEVEPLLNGFTLLERRAKSRSSGGDSYIYLSVDSLYPYERLFAALAEFTKQFPFVHPILRQSTYISPSVEFASHGAGLCIAQRSPQEPLSQPILDVRLRAVARADHPLNILGRQLTQVDLLQHLAAMIEGPLRNESSRQPRNPAQRFLSISTIEAAIEAVRSGMCFGWLPLYRIEQFLNSGELVGLNLPIGAERTLRLHIISKDMDITSREQGVLANLFGANRSPEMI